MVGGSFYGLVVGWAFARLVVGLRSVLTGLGGVEVVLIFWWVGYDWFWAVVVFVAYLGWGVTFCCLGRTCYICGAYHGVMCSRYAYAGGGLAVII